MSARVLEYFWKHKNIIEENLHLCEDPLDIEAIHNLRLSVKRIRVVERLSGMINPESFDTCIQFKEINKLFRRSGSLRDIQVTRQLLIDFQNPVLKPVIERFKHRESKQRKKFENALEIFKPEVLDDLGSDLAIALEEVSPKAVLQAGLHLLSEMEIEVHELFHGGTKEKRLHRIRTRLKDMNYLNNIFDGGLPIEDQLNISAERLRELGEIAGSWHDFLNLESKLGKFICKHPGDINTESLKDIISELKIKKQELYQEYVCILMNEMKV
jgi:CHAD domain-containing protein